MSAAEASAGRHTLLAVLDDLATDFAIDLADEAFPLVLAKGEEWFNLTCRDVRGGGALVDDLAACFVPGDGHDHAAFSPLATFRPGTVRTRSGRRGANVARVLGLLLDADLKLKWAHERGIDPGDEVGLRRIEAEIHALDDGALAGQLAEMEPDVQRAFVRLGVPAFQRIRTGYGFQSVVALDPADQRTPLAAIKARHGATVDALNAVAGYVLFDEAVKDSGSRVGRLAASYNRKNKDRPRPVRLVEKAGARVRVSDLPRPPDRGAFGGGRTAGAAKHNRVGGDFNARTPWPDLLEEAGWARVGSLGGSEYWLRPGKEQGHSATLNYQGSGLFYAFTSSTALPAHRSFDQFGFYAFWHCGGDFREATRRLAARGFGQQEEGAVADGPYAVREGRICFRKRERDGDVWLPLCNFAATIAEEVIADDGLRETGELVIRGALESGMDLPVARVPLARFASMEWVIPQWGTGAVIGAGMGAKDRLREAIQRLSPGAVRRRVYTHPGWRRIGDDWFYLHAGGAVGAVGAVFRGEIALPRGLARLRLPDPPEGDELRAAVLAGLGVRDVAPDRIGAPLQGAVFAAPLGEVMPVDASPFLTGPSGAHKTELAAVMQRFFGPEFDRLTPPGSFLATANALEKLAFDYKDAVCLIDDFAPTGSAIEQARYHATADRVFRGAGNRTGRGRMTAGGELRPEYVPRGLVVATGEDIPRGQSCRARLVVVEVERGDVDLAVLTRLQEEPGRSMPARAMAAYVHWLAARLDGLAETLPPERRRLRAAIAATHPRTPDAVAALAVGWRTWLRFAAETGALTRAEATAAWERAWAGLVAVAAAQGGHQHPEEPAARFAEVLRAAITRGEAHVAGPDGGEPDDAGHWGWQHITIGTGLDRRDEWRERGPLVGWLDGDDLYLEPTSAYAAAQRLAGLTGGALTVQPQTLFKRLNQGGYLRTTGDDGRLKVRKTIAGQRHYVLHVAAALGPTEKCAK